MGKRSKLMDDLVLLATIKAMNIEWPFHGLIIIYLQSHFEDLPDHICKMIADLVWTVQQGIPF